MEKRLNSKHPTPNGSSKTQQGMERESNINHIMARHKETGVMAGPTGRSRRAPMKPYFGDFSNVDFRAMMEQVMDIKNRFMTLSPRLRARFMGDPALLIRFVNDPRNRAECLRLGLVAPTPEEREELLAQDARKRAQEAKEAREQARQLDLEEEAERGVKAAAKPDPEANPRGRKS